MLRTNITKASQPVNLIIVSVKDKQRFLAAMAKPTRFAAHVEPLQVFQDEYVEQPAHSISRAPMPSIDMQHTRALQNSNGNVILHPPGGHGKPKSPFKATGKAIASSPLSPLKSSHGNKINPVSLLPPSCSGHPTDSMPKKQPVMSKFKTVAQKPPVIEQHVSFGKENVHPTLYPAPLAPMKLNLQAYYQKHPSKRALLEAAPIQDRRGLGSDDFGVLPPHDSFPQIVDDGQKPPHSYAQLIGMAILRAANRRLTLSQIYKWISDTYTFYNANDAGWQNSIRHNLSLNKAFIKQERPKDDPGKGNYWAIEPGMEQQFMKEKPTRKSASSAENVPVMSSRLELAHMEPTVFADGLPSLPPVMMAAQQPVMYAQASISSGLPMPTVPEAAEVSSDATIPLSDNAIPEELADKPRGPEGNSDGNAYSPILSALHSSPPVPRHIEQRSHTPPPVSRAPASSGFRNHKRKVASMDGCLEDSGYISSLESSALRHPQGSRGLPSEADRPRIKRGRAEEEIARLRASSYDSPTKGRSWGSVPPSSSPLRPAHESSQMLPPLTPAVKIKAPMRPPPSVSPSTNLRLHRDKVNHMLNSPLRRVSSLTEEMVSGSPAFNIDDSFFNFNDFINDGNDFDIFQDSTLDSFFAAADAGSPIKRSAKRQRMDRSHSTSALGDITNSASKRSTTATPFLKVPNQPFPEYETPSKVFEGMSSPSKIFLQSPIAVKTASAVQNGEWPNLDDVCTSFFMDENDENAGLDILQDFPKIGGSSMTSGQSKSSKPPLGRSYTTTF